jgi:hypothetical protein
MKTAKISIISILLLSAVLTGFACKSITEPEANITPGRRDYTWTIDTLNLIAPYDSYNQLWGTSPENIWCYGFGDMDKMMLHYDGKKWEQAPLQFTGYFQPWSIFGFTPNEFWIGGYESDIWKYNNGKITKFGDYKLDGYLRVYYSNIWGDSPNDLYAVGCAYKISDEDIYAIVMHYDGTDWKYLVKPEINMQFMDIKRGINDSPNYYLMAYKYNSSVGDSVGLYEFDGNNLKRLYFEKNIHENYPGILLMNNNIYFGFKKVIHKYHNGQFIPWLDLSNYNLYGLGQIFGRNEKDIFCFMEDGLGHYNGTDLVTIYKGNWGLGIHSGLLFEKDLFVICADWDNKYYLLHGKLN